MVWGIDSLDVKWTESGEVIRFSYRVLDPEKAKVLNDKKNEPSDRSSGRRQTGGALLGEGGAIAPEFHARGWEGLLDGFFEQREIGKARTPSGCGYRNFSR